MKHKPWESVYANRDLRNERTASAAKALPKHVANIRLVPERGLLVYDEISLTLVDGRAVPFNGWWLGRGGHRDFRMWLKGIFTQHGMDARGVTYGAYKNHWVVNFQKLEDLIHFKLLGLTYPG